MIIRPGILQLAEDLSAVEVHYESQEFTVMADGSERPQAAKQGVKRIQFDLAADADLLQAAQRIVADCKLLHAQRVDEVAALLAEARSRLQAAPPAAAPPRPGSGSTQLEVARPRSDPDRQLLQEQQHAYLAAAAAGATQALAAAAGTARVERLEEYLEALYEDGLQAKTAAAAAIAQLFRDPRHLGTLAAHPTLLQALARLLREDASKGSELCLSLLMAFFALSSLLPQAHPLLLQNQVGSLTMELLDLELRRAEHWQQRDGASTAAVRAALAAGEPLAAPQQRLAAALARQEPLLFAGLSLLLNMAEDVAVEQKMMKKGLLRLLAPLLDRGSPQLLSLATAFLHKLSLFADNSAALREAGVAGRLAALLPPGRGASAGRPLLLGVLRLLRNLSFDGGMRQQMAAAGLIAKAAALLKPEGGWLHGGGGGSAGPAAAAVREPAPAPQQQQQHREGQGQGRELGQLVFGLLYHLSLQHKHRSMFLYTGALPLLFAMLLQAQPPLAAACPELAALLISLAGSCRVAEELARGGRLEQLLELAVGRAEPATLGAATLGGAAEASTAGDPAAAGPSQAGQQPQWQAEPHQASPAAAAEAAEPPAAAPAAAAEPAGRWSGDELLWKLLRAVAEHDSEPLRARFAPSLHRITSLLTGGGLPPPAYEEALACFAALDIPGFDYAQLLRTTQLPALLAELAAGGGGGRGGGWEGRQSVTLQVVHALGVLCADDECASLLASAGLVEALHAALLRGAAADEEGRGAGLLLASTAAAARLLARAPTRAALLAHPELAALLADLLQHPCHEVAQAADAALEAVAAASGEWAASVQRLKFEAHNREWLQAVRQEGAACAAGGGWQAGGAA